MDGTLGSAVLDGETLTFTYDGLKRLSSRITPRLQTVYSYKNVGTKTTTQIAGVSYKNAAGTANILPADGYTYDVMGNITKVTSGTTVISQYEYDNQNQLVSEVRNGGYEDSYVYDTYGNIRSIARENPGAGVSNTYTFTYSTEDWKDQLVGVTYKDDSGQSVSGTLTYDNMGNPLTYFNGHNSWNFTWKYGKQLASATDGTNTITNAYDVDGIRKSKVVNGVEHEYVTLNKKVMSESYGNVKIQYFYDNENRPYKIVVDENGTTYTGYYIVNWQGDVIAITDSSGEAIVKYTYDAWGNVVGSVYEKTEGLSNTLYEYNALKYRGYYYDADLELYYLNTRYYDPVICRFISADDVNVLSVDQENFLQYNFYTYGMNNPANGIDSSGMSIGAIMAVAIPIVVPALISGLISSISYAVGCEINGENIDGGEMLGAFLFSAGCSVADSLLGVLGVGKLCIAAITGTSNAIYTSSTGGSMQESFSAGIVSGLSCYFSSYIPQEYFGNNMFSTDTMENAIKELTVGSFTEHVSFQYQNAQWASKKKVYTPSSNYLTSQNPKETKIGCRAPEGTNGLCDYRAKRLAMGLSW